MRLNLTWSFCWKCVWSSCLRYQAILSYSVANFNRNRRTSDSYRFKGGVKMFRLKTVHPIIFQLLLLHKNCNLLFKLEVLFVFMWETSFLIFPAVFCDVFIYAKILSVFFFFFKGGRNFRWWIEDSMKDALESGKIWWIYPWNFCVLLGMNFSFRKSVLFLVECHTQPKTRRTFSRKNNTKRFQDPHKTLAPTSLNI